MKKIIKCKNNIDKEMTIEEVLKEFDGVTVKPCGKWMHTYEIDDLKQIAYMSIIKAYNHYDVKNNVPFAVYAQNIINNDLINQHKRNNRQKRGRDIEFTSIYATVDETEDLKMIDTIKDENYNCEELALNNIVSKKILEVLKTFSIQDREMIDLHFIKGLNGAEIGRMYNKTRACISYRLKIITEKLQRQLSNEMA